MTFLVGFNLENGGKELIKLIRGTNVGLAVGLYVVIVVGVTLNEVLLVLSVGNNTAVLLGYSVKPNNRSYSILCLLANFGKCISLGLALCKGFDEVSVKRAVVFAVIGLT